MALGSRDSRLPKPVIPRFKNYSYIDSRALCAHSLACMHTNTLNKHTTMGL